MMRHQRLNKTVLKAKYDTLGTECDFEGRLKVKEGKKVGD